MNLSGEVYTEDNSGAYAVQLTEDWASLVAIKPLIRRADTFLILELNDMVQAQIHTLLLRQMLMRSVGCRKTECIRFNHRNRCSKLGFSFGGGNFKFLDGFQQSEGA